MKAKYVPDYSIVTIRSDGRMGMLTRVRNNKVLIKMSDDFAVEIKNSSEVDVVVYPAIGMMRLLKQLRRPTLAASDPAAPEQPRRDEKSSEHNGDTPRAETPGA